MNSLRLFLSQKMTEVDKRINDVMSAHKVGSFPVKANQQGAELVNPSEGAFTAKALFVDFRIKQAFWTALGLFAGALVFSHIGNDRVVEACPAGSFGVKSGIGIEVAADHRNTQTLDELESGA